MGFFNNFKTKSIRDRMGISKNKAKALGRSVRNSYTKSSSKKRHK